jgi:hypothetical protein
MTTFVYPVVLDDTECIAVEAALDLLIAHCDKELADGPCAPYFVWRDSAVRVKGRLYADAVQTSGNYTDSESGEFRIWIASDPSEPSTKD